MADVGLVELDRMAPKLLSEGRPVRVLEAGNDLAERDFRGHPWARLLVGCALSDVDPTDVRGLRHAQVALEAFRRRGDGTGEAYACYVLGSRALERGAIGRASGWWVKARRASGNETAGFEIMLAHLGLAAYADGRLAAALAASEEALALAQLRGSRRAEATALVDIAFFRLWTGDFARALAALDAAEDAFDGVADAFERFELPLCLGARGVLWALRGDLQAADRELTRALQVAQQLQADRYRSILLAARAEFTASLDHRRARRDAAAALEDLERRGDRWWQPWAAQAAAVVAAHAGLHDTADAILQRVRRTVTTTLERARTELLLGEALLQAGRATDAGPPLHDAAVTFERAGACYWQVRSYVGLASARPAEGRMWISRAKVLATDDPAYRRLFSHGTLQLRAIGLGQIFARGQPLVFHTHRTEQALFLLALAGPDGLHSEQLASRLWPRSPADRRRLLSRVRTLLWDMRHTLGAHGWRVERHGAVLRLDLEGVDLDIHELRAQARQPPSDRLLRRALADQLRRPVLTRWVYEDWVVDENHHNTALANQVDQAP